MNAASIDATLFTISYRPIDKTFSFFVNTKKKKKKKEQKQKHFNILNLNESLHGQIVKQHHAIGSMFWSQV